ncbi:hypothetical protein OG21DRAFT_1512784 [Imleria badia]|nr:hypothetical protein OG21DRAFT_1512784 [Imleria badia]
MAMKPLILDHCHGHRQPLFWVSIILYYTTASGILHTPMPAFGYAAAKYWQYQGSTMYDLAHLQH